MISWKAPRGGDGTCKGVKEIPCIAIDLKGVVVSCMKDPTNACGFLHRADMKYVL
jgi:hypothetical protein